MVRDYLKIVLASIFLLLCGREDLYGQVRNGLLFAGGEGDGSAKSCVAPVIKFHGDTLTTCVDSMFQLRVLAEGTDIEYVWQKKTGAYFINVTADDQGRILGCNTNTLTIKQPDKIKDDGIYRCKVTNDCGAVYSVEMVVNLSFLPKILSGLNAPSHRCVGAVPEKLAVVVPASSSYTYSWNKIDDDGTKHFYDVENNIYNNPFLEVKFPDRTAQGYYVVDITNECGVISDSAYLNVYAPVSIELTNIDANREIMGCMGDDARFSIRLQGGGSFNYSLKAVELLSYNPLKYNVKKTVGNNSPELILSKLEDADKGYYIWEARNECGVDTSELINLFVDTLPKFVFTSPDVEVCEEGEVTLSVMAQSKKAITYNWFHNGISLGKSGAQLKLSPVAVDAGGVYTCEANNGCNSSSTSPAIRLKVKNKPYIMRDPYLPKPTCEGDTLVVMSVTFSSIPIDSMRWFRDFRPVYDIPDKTLGATTPSMGILDVEDTDQSVYFIRAYNECGYTESQRLDLRLKRKPKIVRSFNGLADLVLCDATDQTLSVEVMGDTAIRYIWLHDQRVIADGYSGTMAVAGGVIDTANVYCVHVQNMCGEDMACSKLRVAKITPYDVRVEDENPCAGYDKNNRIIISHTDTNIIYTLYKKPANTIVSRFPGKDSPDTLRNLDVGNYYVTGLDTNGCERKMKGDPVIQYLDSPNEYSLSITRQKCQGSDGAILALSGSDENEDIEYTLYRQLGGRDKGWYTVPNTTKKGTGYELRWDKVDYGRYKVVATHLKSGCKRDMILFDSVEIKPVPKLFNFHTNGKTGYCSTEDASHISLILDGYEAGCRYTLKRNGSQYMASLSRSPIQWAEAEHGKYQVTIQNQWCTTLTPEIEIAAVQPPQDLPLTGGGVFCDDTIAGRQTDIVLNNTEQNIFYELYRVQDEKLLSKFVGNGRQFKVSVPANEGYSYRMYATDPTKNCKIALKDVEVKFSNFQAVTDPRIITIRRYATTSLHVNIEGAYKAPLYINWSGPYLVPLRGNNPDLFKDRNTYQIPGDADYTVTAKDANGCVKSDNVKVRIMASPLLCEIRTSEWYFNSPTCRPPGCYINKWNREEYEYVRGHYCISKAANPTNKKKYERMAFCATVMGGEEVFQRYLKFIPDDPISTPITWGDVENTGTWEALESGTLYLTVTSGLEIARDSIRILVKETPLEVALKDELGGEPDTLKVCIGEKINLYGWYAGGNQPATRFLWGGDGYPGTDLTNAHNLVDFRPTYSGYVWFQASNDSETQRDSVYIKLVKSPTLYTLSNQINHEDVRYVQAGVQEIITLPDTDPGTEYILEFAPKGTSVFGEYGLSQQGWGGSVSFPIFNPEHFEGKFRVRAVVQEGIYTCDQVMEGVVEFIVYRDLIVEIRNADNTSDLDTLRVCEGDPISLTSLLSGGNGPVTDVVWYFDGKTVEQGGLISDFIPIISSKMILSATSKNETRSDTVFIKLLKRPVVKDIDNPGSYVIYSDGQPEEITISDTEPSLNYYLQFSRDGKDFLDFGDPQTGGGVVSFIIQQPLRYLGVFRIRAENITEYEEDVCSTVMRGTVTYYYYDPNNPGGGNTPGGGGDNPGGGGNTPGGGGDNPGGGGDNPGGGGDNPGGGGDNPGGGGNTPGGGPGGGGGIVPPQLPDDIPGTVTTPMKDSIWVCEGDELYVFTSWILGYDEKVSWYTLRDKLSAKLDVTWRPKKSGYLYLERSGALGVLKDSMYVTVIPKPKKYSIVGNVAHCVGGIVSDTIRLEKSEPGVIYTLEYSVDGVDYQAFGRGTRLVGWGGLLKFIVEQPERYPGFFTIRATRIIEDRFCEVYMLGMVEMILNPGVPRADVVYYYCEGESGAEVRLKNVQKDEKYSIYRGTALLETIKSPSDIFQLKYTAGNYLFSAAKMGYHGTCKLNNIPLGVVRSKLPSDTIKVIAHGVQCEGELTTVELKSTQKNIVYSLLAPKTLDTLSMITGDGLNQIFGAFATQEGTYRIVAENAEGCINQLTPVKINKIPKDIWIDTCEYCYEYGSVAATKTCELNVKGLESDIKYVLYNSQLEQGSIFGLGQHTFKGLVGGMFYRVDAIDTISGCVATVAKTRVEASEKPCPIGVNKKCGIKESITMKMSEPGVTYYLYRDEKRVLSGDSIIGTGAAIDFGPQDTAGIYTVYAKRGEHDYCLTRMQGEVSIYILADTASLEVIGKACTNSGGVELLFPCSTRGWEYYIQDGNRFSERVQGNGDTIVFSRINNSLIRGGKYYMYADNGCANILLDSATVVADISPRAFSISPQIASFCPKDGVEIKISDSEKDIRYIAINEIAPNKMQPVISNIGTGLTRPYVIGKIYEAGIYQVYAVNEQSGCETYMGRARLTQRAAPLTFDILGKDTCKTLNSGAKMDICLPNKEGKINYYLNCDKLRVATLSKDVNQMCFPQQNIEGCYTVTAQHTETGCLDTLHGTYCLGDEPIIFDMDKNGLKKVNGRWALYGCEGDELSLWLANSQKGVKYVLVKDGVDYGDPVTGTGFTLRVGDPKESGEYWVRAFNGCEQLMRDTVIVQYVEAPIIDIRQDLRYCKEDGGVQIIVKDALPNSHYVLYKANDRYNSLDARGTGAIPGDLVFNGYYTGPEKYVITLLDNTTACHNEVDVDITPVDNPKKFKLKPVKGNYICGGEDCVELKLTGSEVAVEYILKETNIGLEEDVRWGNGGALILKACYAGMYQAEAIMLDSPYCSNLMENDVIISGGREIQSFAVTGENTNYCWNSSPDKKTKVILHGSEMGIIYELYDGETPTGITKIATTPGEILKWEGVSAKRCELNTDEYQGSEFVIIATDPATLCTKMMDGIVQAIEDEQPIIKAFYPTNDIMECEGNPVNFNVVADGCSLQYAWSRRNSSQILDTLPYLKIEEVDAKQADFYSCTVSNSCGSISTDVVLLTVRPVAKFDKLPMPDVHLCDNSDGLLVSTIVNVPENGYVWCKIADSKDPMVASDTLGYDRYLEFSPAKMTDAGEYVCIGTTYCGELRDTCKVFIDQSLDSLGLNLVEDTVCIGTNNYTISLPINNPIEWYKNGLPTGNTSHSYLIPQVGRDDEGIYSIRISNSCETRLFPIKRVWVDDTIRILDITPDAILCGGQPIDLYINTLPWERVSYKWYEGADYIGSGKSVRYLLTEGKTQRSFFVEYSNSCYPKERAAVNISLNGQITMVNPPREIVLCADAIPKDTCLIADALNTMVTSYKWHFNKKIGDQIIEKGIVGRDSKHCLNISTSNSGFYYCEMETTCGKMTSETSWVIIDSIPTIGKLQEKETVCEGAYFNFALAGSGGSLFYHWIKMDKDGIIDTIRVERALDFDFISSFRYGPISFADDGAKIWCDLVNDCGKACSDTMTLVVTPKRSVTINVSDTTICAGTEAMIILELQQGLPPWVYSYRKDGGKNIDRTVKYQKDTLYLSESGVYEVTKLRDAVQCEYTEDLLMFTIRLREVPEVGIQVVGKDTICLGDEITLQVDISQGQGPWEVEVFRKSDGQFANELDITNPMLIAENNRSFTLKFIPEKTDTLYINAIRDLYGGLAQCNGNKKEQAGYLVAERDNIKFGGPESDILGICEVWSLVDSLKPSIPGGEWWIDGAKSSNDIFSGLGNKEGWHDIVYKTKNLFGCDGMKKTRLYVSDPANVDLHPIDTNICMNGTAKLRITFTGQAPYTLKYQPTRVKWDKSRETGTMVTELCQTNVLIKDIPYSPADSAYILNLFSVSDKFNCQQVPTLNTKSVVYFRKSPEYKVYGKNLGKDWTTLDPYYLLRSNDTIWFKVELTNGIKPWKVVTSRWAASNSDLFATHDVKTSQDTTFETILDGTYSFNVSDRYCSKMMTGEQKTVSYIDTGYIKVKVLLEGALTNDQSGNMASLIETFLPHYKGIKALPVTGKDLIDWIILEFRDQYDKSKVLSRDTFLLRSDGWVVSAKGDTILPVADVGDQNCYVVVKHRNHLSVMSKITSKMWISKNIVKNEPVLDFRNWRNIYTLDDKAENHMTQVDGQTGLWALSAGDVLLNRLLSIADPNEVKAADRKEVDNSLWGIRGYYVRDVNFDGVANWAAFVAPGVPPLTTYQDDKIVFKNRYKFTEVPLSK